MKTLDQSGRINALLIPLILITLMFLGSLGFGLWAYTGREDFKNNVDEKVGVAVKVAIDKAKTEKDNEFIEKEKEPLSTYKSPNELGTINIRYPKTWSAYVDETGRGSAELDGYFNPLLVPGVSSGKAYALRLQLINKSFDVEAKSFDGPVKQGKIKAQPYQPKNLPNIVGLRLDGEIRSGVAGVMILIPLRDKTIKIFTESDQFIPDLERHVLENLNFAP
jgi:hypothetical protein